MALSTVGPAPSRTADTWSTEDGSDVPSDSSDSWDPSGEDGTPTCDSPEEGEEEDEKGADEEGLELPLALFASGPGTVDRIAVEVDVLGVAVRSGTSAGTAGPGRRGGATVGTSRRDLDTRRSRRISVD